MSDRPRALAAALLAAAVLTGCTAEPPEEEKAEDGAIPGLSGVSPYDVDHPALAGLDPALREAVRRAADGARAKGVDMKVTSGWRSADYQQHLLDAAVGKYGSLDEARKWVKAPDASSHVTGDAVDIGPTDAADWLVRNGSDYGLCQAYSNEMWHFELLTEPGGECPQPRSDAAE